MGSGSISCTKGDDAPCVAAYGSVEGEGACCFYIKVIQENDNADTTQQSWIDSYKALGYPVTKGAEGFYCQGKTEVEAHVKNDKHNMFQAPYTDIKYEGYCAGALTNVVMGVSAIATLAVATTF